MEITVDPKSEPSSGMPDLRTVPLADLAAGDIGALSRIVPSSASPRVSVAAFQSGI